MKLEDYDCGLKNGRVDGHWNGFATGYGYYGYGDGRQDGAGNGYGVEDEAEAGLECGSGTGCGYKTEYGTGYGFGSVCGSGYGTDLGYVNRYRYEDASWIALNSFSSFIALLDPACIPEAMLVDSNAEIRRLSLARYGVDRFLASGKVIHARGDYALIERACVDFPMRALKMLCPSTNAVYISPVPPHCKTVEQALRWKYQTEDYFANLVEEA